MNDALAGTGSDMKMYLRFRLVASPGPGAVAKQEVHEIACLVARFIQAEIGNSHCRFMDRMQHGKTLLSAFARCYVRIIFVDRHLETLVTQYNSRSGTGNFKFDAHYRPRYRLSLTGEKPSS
jgi:hypothetical protein